MYPQTSPEMPNQMYAELVQSRDQERLARRVARTRITPTPSVVRRTTRRLAARMKFANLPKITTARKA